ncbi:MAG: hypothetical protein HY547_05330 [Elusimicrobia bacterium]|nr:hypothetical protein [Elusimicrobiota bacterium]
MGAASGGLFATPALGVGLILVGVYRYSLIASLLNSHAGSWGITLFTSMLFLPSFLAFYWRSELERRGQISLAVIGAALMFLGLAAATHRGMGLAGYAMNAFLLGLMEALLVPALQNWFSQKGKGGLAVGNATLWGLSCCAIVLSPALFSRLIGSIPMGIIGAVGIATLVLLIVGIIAGESTETALPPPKNLEKSGMRIVLAVLFLAGAASGAMTNMIYPLALRLLGLKGFWIGFYACVPLFSAALGAWLFKIYNRGVERWFLFAFLAIPILFLLAPHRMALAILFSWGLCMGFIETNWLGKQKNFNVALSAKNWGLAAGIVCSGLAAQAGMSPIGAISAGFYGTLAIGVILWMAF